MFFVGKHAKKSPTATLFLKAMLITVCAVLLIVIGYFTAGYFFGGL